jgi:hypothetical protein
MITLLNSKGQLGTVLKEQIKSFETTKNVFIYHTWNVWDKNVDPQKKEYDKFKTFVDDNKDKGRIIFISTYSEGNNYYVHYKQKSEAYLLSNCEDCLIIRFPNLIGNKGIFNRLKNKECEPYGEIEIMSLEEASTKILELINYDGLVKSFTVKGETINVVTLNKIIHAF